MRSGEAVSLLRQGLPGGRDVALEELAARLGEWPLLLRLVNGVLRERTGRARQPLDAAIAYVNTALDRRGLTAFDASKAEDRNQAVKKTLDLSLELLSEAERARFAKLAVFPEDAEVPLAAVETLWNHTAGLDALDTEDLCLRLFRLSLLLTFDLATRRLRLHDVVRAYLLRKAEDPRKLHAQVVEAYRARCPDDWAHGADDVYLFQYLAYHLSHAGEHAALRSLLLDFGWIAEKLRRGGFSACIADYRFLPEDLGTRRVLQALWLSSRFLTLDSEQLSSQLLGRLAPEDGEGIGEFLTEARCSAGKPALLPIRPTLNPPGTPLLGDFLGHKGSVTAVAVTPDGGRALSASRDGTLRLWDLTSGAELRRLEGHEGRVTAVAVMPGGGRVLSASEDRTLRLWDLASGAALRHLKGHDGGVTAVAMTPDGGRALSASSDHTLRLWNLTSGAELRRLEGHGKLVTAVVVTPDGGRALSASNDGTLRLWDLASGAELRRLEGHESWVTTVAVTPDGGRALSASRDGTLRLWDLASGAALRRLKEHWDRVTAVAVTPDGERALSASRDGTLRLWELTTGASLRRWAGHGSAVTAVTRDGGRALSASDDRTLRLWDLASGAVLATFHAEAALTCCAVTPDGRYAIAGDELGRVHMLEIIG